MVLGCAEFEGTCECEFWIGKLWVCRGPPEDWKVGQGHGFDQVMRWEGNIGDLVNFDSYQTVREQFLEEKWAGYVAGCISVLWKDGYVR